MDTPPLHLRSPEVARAIMVVRDIVMRYRAGDAALVRELTDFFDEYDKVRSEQIEWLNAEVVRLRERVTDPIIVVDLTLEDDLGGDVVE
jgi:hypothetical protein